VTADESAINAILQNLEAAWNSYDSVRWTALFADDATFIHIYGGQLDGRAAIEGSHRVIWETIYKGSRASFTLRNIRFLRSDVAVLFANAHVKFTEGPETRKIETRPTLIVVKEQGSWRIVAFQNTKISAIPATAEAAARLAT
jgi:uncharacterized protein (TIGR02246 family)